MPRSGLPHGVLNYLPGWGETAGAALVEHPATATVAFTGCARVGLRDPRAAEVSAAGGGTVKHVIAEMGGKNAIIVDDDADLDEAVLGVMKSAFGYQGQKCSACSRAIVLPGIYDQFVQRLTEASRSLKVGPAEDPATSVGPLIDEDGRCRRAGQYIDLGRKDRTREALLLVDVGALADEGYFVGPHIFADVVPDSRLAQEEVFGPVLAVLRARDFDDALRIANDSDYALTGGVFSRTLAPQSAQRPARSCWSATLYLNRGISGGPGRPPSRSAASKCRASAARPAAPITCSNSCFRGRSPSTPCAAASPRTPVVNCCQAESEEPLNRLQCSLCPLNLADRSSFAGERRLVAAICRQRRQIGTSILGLMRATRSPGNRRQTWAFAYRLQRRAVHRVFRLLWRSGNADIIGGLLQS